MIMHCKNLYKNKSSTQLVLLTATAILFTSPLPVYSQGILEEVVVTARKREESLQDVPISVQALSGEFIQEQGIMDVQALAPYTPNFTYATATGASDILVMRGMGTIGSGVHFEPAVGQVLNGYFSTRSRLGRTALIDLAQIEVLKGPQGAIVGKNTSLGALNIRSNRPTEEFEAKLSTGYNFDHSEGYEVEGIVSGPLTDRIRARAVVNYRDIDGWIQNRNLNSDIQERTDLTTRLMLAMDITEDLSAELMWQRNDLDREGKGREPYICFNPAVSAAQGADCSLNASNQNGNIRRGVEVGEPYTTEGNIYGLTFNWDFEDFTITSLSSFTEYEITDLFDADQRPIERVSIDNFEEYSQFTQEIRLTSTGDNLIDYTLGFMYFTGEMDFKQNTNVAPANTMRHESAGSETDSIAAFGQLDWHINDAFSLTFGGRLTHEDREGQKRQIQSLIYSAIFEGTPIENPVRCVGTGLLGCTNGNDGNGINGAPILGEISKTNFSYNVSLTWNYNDTSMFYATHATGFKSGGFDLRGLGNPARFIFDEEESTNYEIGGKHTFLDGSLRFNWTAYIMEVDGLQLSTNDPVNVQQIVGQADAESSGVEFDILWAATEALNVSVTGSYLDTEYDRFFGACFSTQTVAQGCGVDTNDDGILETVQDQAGQDLAYAPDLTLVLGGDYTWQVGDNMDLKASIKWIYEGERFQQVDNSPFAVQESTNRLDASLVLSGSHGSNPWTVALIGRNLSDEIVNQFSSGSTLAGGGSNVLFTTTEELRVISLKASYGW